MCVFFGSCALRQRMDPVRNFWWGAMQRADSKYVSMQCKAPRSQQKNGNFVLPRELFGNKCLDEKYQNLHKNIEFCSKTLVFDFDLHPSPQFKANNVQCPTFTPANLFGHYWTLIGLISN